MLRFLKRVCSLIIVVLIVGAFGYFVILPRVLPLEYADIIEKYAEENQIDESLVYAVIFCESRFDPDAHSRADAKGLMQITEETGRWIADRTDIGAGEELNLKDPETNIAVGTWYLSWLEEKFSGEQTTVLAAYNAGPNKVTQWLENEEYSEDGYSLMEIPYGETNSYVRKVDIVQKLYQFFYIM